MCSYLLFSLSEIFFFFIFCLSTIFHKSMCFFTWIFVAECICLHFADCNVIDLDYFCWDSLKHFFAMVIADTGKFSYVHA